MNVDDLVLPAGDNKNDLSLAKTPRDSSGVRPKQVDRTVCLAPVELIDFDVHYRLHGLAFLLYHPTGNGSSHAIFLKSSK
jgi:hypothetical protein